MARRWSRNLSSFPVRGPWCSLVMDWTFTDDRYLHWRKFDDGSLGEIEAQLGKSAEKIPTRVKSMPSEQVLAEAFFF